MSEEYYRSWYIEGMAESVIEEMKKDGEEPDNVLDDYLQDTYWREAKAVAKKSRKKTEETAETNS